MRYHCLNDLKKYGFEPKKILDIGACWGGWFNSTLKVFPEAQFTLIDSIEYQELKTISQKTNHKVFFETLSDNVRDVEWYEKRNTRDSIYREKTSFF